MTKYQYPEPRPLPLFLRPTLPLEFSEDGLITTYSGVGNQPMPVVTGRLKPSESDPHSLNVDLSKGAELDHAALYAAYVAYGLKKKVSLTSNGEPLPHPIEIDPADAETSEPLADTYAEEVLNRFDTIKGVAGLREESKLIIGAMAKAAIDGYLRDSDV